MKKLLLFTLLFSLCAIWAQSQTTAYLKVSDDYCLDRIEKVTGGGYITVAHGSAYNPIIIRYDDYFNMLWQHTFTDTLIMYSAPKIIEANDGSFYFMSRSKEHNLCTLIVKFSSSGELLWQHIYYLSASGSGSLGLSKAVAGDNGFLFGGGACAEHNFIVKCSPDGNIEWQYDYGYPGTYGVMGCCSIIPDGQDYITLSSYNANALLPIKISSSGTLIAYTDYTYTGAQIIPQRMLKLNSTGGYAILGQYNGSTNNKTAFVAILGQSLNLFAFNELMVTYDQFFLYDITSINNGNNLIVNGSVMDSLKWTAVIINLSNNGNIVWKRRASGNTSTTNKNVEFFALTAFGNKTIHTGCGQNEGSVVAVIDSGGNGLCNEEELNVSNVYRTLNLHSETMIVMPSAIQKANVAYAYTNTASCNKHIYCGNLSGIEDNGEPASIITTLFPNPATTTLTIEGISTTTTAEVYDISGKLLFTKQLNNNQIDISSLARGLYFIKLTTAEGSVVRKFVKE
jgi:hypothetical protein